MFINVASIFLLIVLMYFEIRHFTNAASFELGILTFFSLFWAVGSFMELMVPGLQGKLFWRNFTQIGTFFLPVAALVFTLAYSGVARKTLRTIAAIFYTLQALPVLLIFTDEYHHLMRIRCEIYTNPGGISSLSVVSTLLGYIFVSINFLLIMASLCVLAYFIVRVAKPMRKQLSVVAIGMGIPATYAVFRVIFGEQFAYGIPISSIFAVGCAVLLFGVYRFDFLSLQPIARDQIFDVIDEGIIVISGNNHVVDANQAALRMLFPSLLVQQAERSKLMGEIERVLKEYIGEDFGVVGSEGRNFTLGEDFGHPANHYNIKTHELLNFMGKSIGAVAVLRDVTHEMLQIEQFKLKAEIDGLTSAYNREAFIGLFESARKLKPVSFCLMIFDVDDFKELNDTYGHLAGDMVLRAICACCKKNLRGDDIIGRMGGDEFAIFCPGVDASEAMRVARRILVAVTACKFSHEGKVIHFTISMGIVFLDRKEQNDSSETFIEVFKHADRALYEAKRAGKNRIAWSDAESGQTINMDEASSSDL